MSMLDIHTEKYVDMVGGSPKVRLINELPIESNTERVTITLIKSL